MADLRLASAGDDIKLWDCSGFSQLKQFNPHTNQNISSVCWSNDNGCIASSSTGGDKISFSYPTDPTLDYDMRIGDSWRCLAFNSSSRYVMGGGTDGIIQVWDVKSQKVKKSYRDHKGPVTSVQMNWNDSDLASGSETGEIIIYNVITGQGSIPLTTPRVQAVRQLQYSHFKKSLLAAVSEDGTLNMWDTNRRSLTHSFTDLHKAPATGLAFSQLNEMLMVSVGLDKRIVCYDVQRLEVVTVIMADSPLTSIDLMNDGSTFVVGSTRGKIFVYDLRQAASPVRQMAAHKSSVQRLVFQTKPPGSVGGAPARSRKNSNNNATKTGKVTTSRSTAPQTTTPRSDVQPDLNGVNSQGLDTRNNNRVEANLNKDTVGSDTFFSPIRDRISVPRWNSKSSPKDRISYTRVTSSPAGLLPVSGQPAGDTSADAHSTSSANGSINKYRDGIFSPLCGNGSSYSSRTQFGSGGLLFQTTPFQATLCSQHALSTNSPTTTCSDEGVTATKSDPICSLGPQEPVDMTAIHHSQSEPVITPPSSSRVTRSSSTPLARDSHHNTPEDAGATGVPHEQRLKAASYSTTSIPQEAGASRDASWHWRSQLAPSPHPHPHPHPQPQPQPQPQGAEGGTPANFQLEILRNMIDDALEDFKDQIRRDVLNLHMDMLKQFHIQQTEVRTLVQQYSVNQDLMAEIERLREENDKLKRKF